MRKGNVAIWAFSTQNGVKDSNFHDALFGTNPEKFSAVCELFKDNPVLNAVLNIDYRFTYQTPLTYLIYEDKFVFLKYF